MVLRQISITSHTYSELPPFFDVNKDWLSCEYKISSRYMDRMNGGAGNISAAHHISRFIDQGLGTICT